MKTTVLNKKEYGSDFHFCSDQEWIASNPIQNRYLSPDFSLTLSGRSALLGILQHGMKKHGWRTVYFPSYYCHEVVKYLRKLDIDVQYYAYNPFTDSIEKNIGVKDISQNVIINTNYFGLKALTLSCYQRASVIDDISHHISKFPESTAMYCIGSLRKELPLPVGGFCFSPLGYDLPPPTIRSSNDELVVGKLTAMYLKNMYLKNAAIDKSTYLKIFANTEIAFNDSPDNYQMPLLAKDILMGLDVEKILRAKQDNIKSALKKLKPLRQWSDVRVNFGMSKNAFGLLLEVGSHKFRDALRTHLIAKGLYPAVLWPNQMNPNDKETGNRSLFIHMDYRYSNEDIGAITDIILEYFNN